MPSITREKIQSINSKCWNGWGLDTEYYVTHGGKTLVKNIQIDNENYLQFRLTYNSSNQVTLSINKCFREKGKDYAIKTGNGKTKVLNKRQLTKKSINNLISFTEKLTNAKLLEINENTEEIKAFGLFQQ